jgi:hypothetical protein
MNQNTAMGVKALVRCGTLAERGISIDYIVIGSVEVPPIPAKCTYVIFSRGCTNVLLE